MSIEASGLDLSQATVVAGVLAGIFLANIGTILGTYVSIRVSQAELRVKVDSLKGDVDRLWGNFREGNKSKE